MDDRLPKAESAVHVASHVICGHGVAVVSGVSGDFELTVFSEKISTRRYRESTPDILIRG